MMFVYIIETKTGKLYTGITNNLERRIQEHKGEIPGGARFIKANGFKKILGYIEIEDRSKAMNLENKIKRMSRKRKYLLVELWKK